jgi:hypothetical protein
MWQTAVTRYTEGLKKEIQHFAAVIKGHIDIKRKKFMTC